ncbi:hypothetical protein [Gracilibacillus dipsosauri]|uniref:hypothetical protein n=1 Tax=Gracilibacillus dipsosauri TaxID=178340 RepID=UPI00240A7444
MNLKWLRLLTAVFLSAIMLMGCNNVEEDNDPPPSDTEEPIEDPKDANDPDNVDENKDDEADLVPDTEEPIEDPKDVNDTDDIDE